MLKRPFYYFLKKAIYIILRALQKTTYVDSNFKISLPKDWSSREILLWKLKVINPLLKIDIQFRKNISNKTPIDIVIPVSIKDIKHLRAVIRNAIKYIKHPINQVFVISSANSQVIQICNETGAKFIEETIIQPLEKHRIKYIVDKENRSGWLFQQFLKLSADNFVEMDNYLLLDADTFFLRPKVFKNRNKTIFDLSEERHEPYHHVYEKIFKRKTTSELSFICHYMLFNKDVIRELKAEIEIIHKKKWVEVILENVDYTNKSGFSEYEVYGNFFLEKHAIKLKKEYWFNTIYQSDIQLNYTKTLSSHSYLTEKSLNGYH